MSSPKKADKQHEPVTNFAAAADSPSTSSNPIPISSSSNTLNPIPISSSSSTPNPPLAASSNLHLPPTNADIAIAAGAGLDTPTRSHGPPPWPTITYKHLLSAGTLNPTNPLRVIAHCDVDAAYAQFEANRLGLDATKVPIAVQQWQGLIAVNYPARDAGVSRFEPIQDALKKCPELQLVHVATYAYGSNQALYHENPKPETHKVSLDPYRRESNKILTIFERTCPSGAVEKASIDESYFDLTVEVRKLMIERFPFLKHVPEDDAETGVKGMDQPLPSAPRLTLLQWKQLGYVVPKSGDVVQASRIGRTEKQIVKGDTVAETSIGELIPYQPRFDNPAQPGPEPGPSWSSPKQLTDLTSSSLSQQQQDTDEEQRRWDEIEKDETTWTDIALALGAELMNRVRQTVLNELGYTTSAGIASNKTLAKLCSSWRKPNGQAILRPCSIFNFFSSLPFQKIRFLGGKLGTAIEQEWPSSTVADLWSVPLDEMQAKFGEEARWVYNVLRGIDHSEVKERANNQTMLASKSVRPPITKPEEALHWLTILSTELAIRLTEAREQRAQLWPRTLVFRYIRAGSVPKSRQTAFAFTSRNSVDALAEMIFKKGEKLWNESAADALGRTRPASVADSGKILTIALGFSGLEEGENGQLGIQGFFGTAAATKEDKNLRLPSSALNSSRADPSVDEPKKNDEPRKRKRTRLEDMFQEAKQREKQPTNQETMENIAQEQEPKEVPKQENYQLHHDGSSNHGGSRIHTDAATLEKGNPALWKGEQSYDRAVEELKCTLVGGESNHENGFPKTLAQTNATEDEEVQLEPNGLLDTVVPESTENGRSSEKRPQHVDSADTTIDVAPPCWKCGQCSETLVAPVDAAAFEQPYLLERLKEEHLDWHFALTLSQAERATSSSSAATTVKPKKKPRPKGLDNFFRRPT